MKFNGGNSLFGFLGSVHQIMMLNELTNGEGAYQLSHAKLGESGYSFGGNQLDLLKNKDESVGTPRYIFFDILEKNKKVTFSDDEMSTIKSTISTQGSYFNKESTLFKKINSALSSYYGQLQINKSYQNELQNMVAIVDSRINTAQPTVKEIAKNSEYVRALLCDYHNQFNFSNNGNMHKFLQGEKVKQYDGKTYELNVNGLDEKGLIDNIEQFIKSTEHYNRVTEKFPGDTLEKRRANTNNRLATVKNVMQNQKPITPQQASEQEINIFLSQWNITINLSDPAIKEQLSQIIGKFKAEEQALRESQIIDQTNKLFFAASETFRALTYLGNTVGNAELVKVGQVGMNATSIIMNIASLTGAFGLPQVTGLAALGPYASIAIASLSILNLFNKPDAQENFLASALSAISNQIHSLEETLMNQFSILHQGLSQIFNLLNQSVAQILSNIDAFRIITFAKLEQIIVEIHHLGKLQQRNFEEILLMNLRTHIARLENGFLTTIPRTFTESEIQEATEISNNIETWVTHFSSHSMLNGTLLWEVRPSTSTEEKAWGIRIIDEFAPNPYSIFGYLGNFMKYNGINFSEVDVTKLVNVELWGNLTLNYYLPLLNLLSQKVSYDFINNKLDNLKSKVVFLGKNTSNFLTTLQSDESIHIKLLTEFLGAISNFENFIATTFQELNRSDFNSPQISILEIRNFMSANNMLKFDAFLESIKYYYLHAAVFSELGGLKKYRDIITLAYDNFTKKLVQKFTAYSLLKVESPFLNAGEVTNKGYAPINYLLSNERMALLTMAFYANKPAKAELQLMDLNSGKITSNANINVSFYGLIQETNGFLIVSEYKSYIFNLQDLSLAKELTLLANESIDHAITFGKYYIGFTSTDTWPAHVVTNRIKVWEIPSGKLVSEKIVPSTIKATHKMNSGDNLFLAGDNHYNFKYKICRFNPSNFQIDTLDTFNIADKGTYSIGCVFENYAVFYGLAPEQNNQTLYSMVVYDLNKKLIVNSLPFATYGECFFVGMNSLNYLLFGRGKMVCRWNLINNNVTNLYNLNDPTVSYNYSIAPTIYCDRGNTPPTIDGVIRKTKFYDYTKASGGETVILRKIDKELVLMPAEKNEYFIAELRKNIEEVKIQQDQSHPINQYEQQIKHILSSLDLFLISHQQIEGNTNKSMLDTRITNAITDKQNLVLENLINRKPLTDLGLILAYIELANQKNNVDAKNIIVNHAKSHGINVNYLIAPLVSSNKSHFFANSSTRINRSPSPLDIKIRSAIENDQILVLENLLKQAPQTSKNQLSFWATLAKNSGSKRTEKYLGKAAQSASTGSNKLR